MLASRLTIIALIAFWLLTPDVLCLIPGIDLTEEEHECCERMAGECGNMPMPEFHKCCQTVKRTDALLSSKSEDYPELRQAALPAVNPGFDVIIAATPLFHWLGLESPEKIPLKYPESYSILRI